MGDAALSFDPLSSQGVLFALYSGIRAAEALVSCLEQPALESRWLGEYGARVHGVLAANQRVRRLLYASELRYPESEYWRRQREGCGAAPSPGAVSPGGVSPGERQPSP